MDQKQQQPATSPSRQANIERSSSTEKDFSLPSPIAEDMDENESPPDKFNEAETLPRSSVIEPSAPPQLFAHGQSGLAERSSSGPSRFTSLWRRSSGAPWLRRIFDWSMVAAGLA